LRPDIDSYMLMIAKVTSLRSTCPRRSVGAVLVRDKRIISTGYNGSPPGFKQCDESGCLIHEGHCINTIHAEQNALIRAREIGDTLYCTDTPCVNCLKTALAHNPKIRIVCSGQYDDLARDRFAAFHKIEIEILPLDLEIFDLT
jgi:dCMP deaminase